MKKMILSTIAIASLFAGNINNSMSEVGDSSYQKLQKELLKLSKEIKHLKKDVKRNRHKIKRDERKTNKTRVQLNPMLTNSHLFFQYDLRSSVDYVHYKLNNGKKYSNTILSNRVNLTGVARPSDNLKATVMLSVNNIYGMNSEKQLSSGQNNSLVADTTPDDTNVRLKEAFFNYTFGPENDLMFSAGRRPSTEGYPMNLVENDGPNSPLAHLINIEFDGLSFHIGSTALNKILPGASDWGTNIKFCVGRGYSSSQGKYPKNGAPAYTKDNNSASDFGGFILVPYNNGQFSVWNETIWAWKLKDYDKNGNLQDLGNYFGSDLLFKFKGFGDGSNMFLYNTNAFIDLAYTKTKPDNGKEMQGSIDNKNGTSIWLGIQMPGIGNNDTFGFNYVHGSKYFRPMTYGEDTLIGSIAAVRGNAYDFYYNKQIIPHLTAGLRTTYIKYNHSGSEGFMGESSNPDQTTYVSKAYDIKAYIRYKF